MNLLKRKRYSGDPAKLRKHAVIYSFSFADFNSGLIHYHLTLTPTSSQSCAVPGELSSLLGFPSLSTAVNVGPTDFTDLRPLFCERFCNKWTFSLSEAQHEDERRQPVARSRVILRHLAKRYNRPCREMCHQ